MTLFETLRAIAGPDEAAARLARARWNGLAKPLGSLGALEDAVVTVAALRGTPEVQIDRRTLLVFCADNGVAARGVSQSGAEVTRAVTAALGQGRSTVNYMAAAARCNVVPVDLGVLDGGSFPGVRNARVRNSTDDISVGPAMSRAECLQAIETGVALAFERSAAGDDLLLLGEMGIGNTTTACAVAAALLGEEPAALAGRGAGLSDAGLKRKIEVIDRALALSRPDPADPVDVLQKVGGLDLAALCGAVLGAAACRLPVLLDGLITDAAALCAVRLCPKAASALLASHVSAEPAAPRLLRALELRPLICAGLRLGEGSGAVAALGLLDQALAVYHSGHSFSDLGIAPYKTL